MRETRATGRQELGADGNRSDERRVEELREEERMARKIAVGGLCERLRRGGVEANWGEKVGDRKQWREITGKREWQGTGEMQAQWTEM